MCPQCGTRESEWDPDLGGDPDAYEAAVHKCFGCEEIQRKQAEIPEGSAAAGMKVLLLPPAVVAAQRFAKQQQAAAAKAARAARTSQQRTAQGEGGE